MRPIHFAALILAFLFFACNNNKESNIADTTTRDRTNNPVQQNDTNHMAVPPATTEDFLSFWQTFRSAVINKEMSKVIELTEFPFQTRGPMDEDPVVKYNQSQFPRVFSLFLNQSNGIDIDKTIMDDIKKTVVPDKRDVGEDYVRIGDMEFKKLGSQWKFAFAYLNDDTIELLRK